MQVPTLNKEETFQSEDNFLKKIVKHLCVIHDISLTDLECLLLGYYIKYGYQRTTDKLFLERKNVKGEVTLNYIKLKLRKMGALRPNPDNDYMDIHKPFKIKFDTVLGLKILIKHEQ